MARIWGMPPRFFCLAVQLSAESNDQFPYKRKDGEIMTKIVTARSNGNGSTHPDDGQDVETLIQKADTAMYAAKKFGRNNCQFFRADMQARVLERQSLEGDLRYALSRNQFTLRYQPKIDLKTGEITGVKSYCVGNIPSAG
jgi:predicted signal transduction protein with EAL and GGDEF domain